MQTATSDRLVTDHLPYTAAVTNELLNQLGLRTVIRTDDAVSYGRVGLMEAAARFRPEGGASFATFSYSRIRGAVMDGIRRASAETRLFVDPAEDGADPTAGDAHHHRRNPSSRAFFDPTELLDARSLRAALLPAINALTDVERQVILLYYFEDLTFERIADRLGFAKSSTSYVARVHNKALLELARRLRKLGAEYGLVAEDVR
ncbi:MAG TPA: sigma-70 family RNA polymerase sigma factor [Polyangia bacterium]|nr:sigma-70 family RNA polymerase sigma factor [Polyangia bacterium]